MKNYKTILITGASSGIGMALALHYAQSGTRLYVTGRDETRLYSVAELCRARGAHVETAAINVTDKAALSAWMLLMDDRCPIDLVIANAGISGGTGGADGALWVDAEYRIFDVNVTGVLNTILPLVPRMMERKQGQIAIISSLAGYSGWPGAPAYSASKAGVRVYGEALRGTLARYDIGVSVVCPGFVESRMTAVNDYRMPFFMKAEKAAGIIASGLAVNRARIAFPWPTALVSGLMGLLPPALSSRLLSTFPPKPAIKPDKLA